MSTILPFLHNCPVRSPHAGRFGAWCDFVGRQLRGLSLAVLVRFVGWSDQGEVNVFRADVRRAARGKQCVSEFLTALGFGQAQYYWPTVVAVTTTPDRGHR